ncbi:MAG TPA: prolyl aminopeptidase [Burkholderiales bacterium]|nr:prolyl aminopeptidase [Burkholderiales bacterium]
MTPDQNAIAGGNLYPPIEPFRSTLLEVGGGHRIHVEESGNPDGFPVLFVHGGPGSQSRASHRQYFDPGFYRIVLFDQRGCGRSLPFGSTADNTTAHLVADMEAIRRHVGAERWLLFGGSWGSTLSLAYATAYPERVAGLVLRGVFLASSAEVDWFLFGARLFVPEAWQAFTQGTGDSIVEHYRALVDDPRVEVASAAASRWSDYEARMIDPANAAASSGSVSGAEAIGRARVQLHYMAHDFFLRPGELLDNLWRIRRRPLIIVQGRLDMVCPPGTAYDVARQFENADLRMVANGGHSAQQPEMAAQLCEATRRMQAILENGRHA